MDAKYVGNIEGNDDKEVVRESIRQQVIAFANSNNLPFIRLMSLPASQGLFEKGLVNLCKKNGIALNIKGVECNRKIRQDAIRLSANWGLNPKQIQIVKGDLDSHIEEEGTEYNVIWADYCGNPAIYNAEQGRYYYPHLRLFADTVRKSKKPMLYYMTFCCNGRIKNGFENLLHTMGGENTNSLEAAIRAKISCLLSQEGLTGKAKDIMSFSYHGGERSFMFTIGFAIGFDPQFPAVVEKRSKKVFKNGKVSKINAPKNDETDLDSIRKDVIKLLADKGHKSDIISKLLNIARPKVSSVLAWHNHRNSWEG